MTYTIHRTSKSSSTFVITKEQPGIDKASAVLQDQLGDLTPWKTVASMDKAIGAAPSTTIDANIARDGYHVQRTTVVITES